MNKMVEETVKNMMQPGERTREDYIGEDGLLYCGQCHEPKEAYFDQEKIGVLGIKKHPRECECRRQKRIEEEQYLEQQRHEAVVRELKEQQPGQPFRKCGRDPQGRAAGARVDTYLAA